jgi:hypothetical protein
MVAKEGKLVYLSINLSRKIKSATKFGRAFYFLIRQ